LGSSYVVFRYSIPIVDAKALDRPILANHFAVACTVCEVFEIKLYCDLETVVRSRSRSLKVAGEAVYTACSGLFNDLPAVRAAAVSP